MIDVQVSVTDFEDEAVYMPQVEALGIEPPHIGGRGRSAAGEVMHRRAGLYWRAGTPPSPDRLDVAR